jgi:hypothetical protein
MKKSFTLSFLNRSSLVVSSIIMVSLSGCLLSHSNHKVVRQNEPLQQLAFESEQARAVFESRVERQMESDESSASLGIPFLVGLEKTVKTAENAIRNDVATMLDINGDGIVSNHEASLKRF